VSTLDEAKRRILALCPPDQMPMVDFELRMLATSLEAESLNFIHQHWRPIATERDQLRAQLAEALAKPPRDRSAKPSEDATDLPSRFGALTNEHNNLKKQHTALQDRHDDLRAEFLDLQEKHAQLQKDCDDLLNDKRPARTAP
jgi:predicted  nucleic acid-binding Zn-ribbon protein